MTAGPPPPSGPTPQGDGHVASTMAAGVVPTVLYLAALAAGGVPSTSSVITLVAAFLAPTVLASAPSRALQEVRGVSVRVRLAVAWVGAGGFGAAGALRALEDAAALAPGWSALASGTTLLLAAGTAAPLPATRAVRSLLFNISEGAPDGAVRRGRIIAAVIGVVSVVSMIAAVGTILVA